MENSSENTILRSNNTVALATPTPSLQKIPFLRPTLSRDELESVLDCVLKEKFTSSQVCAYFTKKFSKILQLKHCIAVNSLINAYHSILTTLKLGPQDVFIMQPFSSTAAFRACLYNKVQVSLIDIGRFSLHINIEALITTIKSMLETTSARIVVLIDFPLGSYLTDKEKQELTKTLALDSRIILIQDVSALLGVVDEADDFNSSSNQEKINHNSNGKKPIHKLRPTLNLRKRNRYSQSYQCPMQPLLIAQKNRWLVCDLTLKYSSLATSNGAVISCPNESFLQRIDDLFIPASGYIWAKGYESKKEHDHFLHAEHSIYDYRLSDIQAALALTQLHKIRLMTQHRQSVANEYLSALRDLELQTYFSSHTKSSYIRFPIASRRQKAKVIQRQFQANAIEVATLDKRILDYFMHNTKQRFPHAERLYHRGVLLPTYPLLRSSQIERITKVLRVLSFMIAFVMVSVHAEPKSQKLSEQSINKKQNQSSGTVKFNNYSKSSTKDQFDINSLIPHREYPVKIIFCNNHSLRGKIIPDSFDKIPETISMVHEAGQVRYEKQVKRDEIKEVLFTHWQGRKNRKSNHGVIYRFYPIGSKVTLKNGKILKQNRLSYKFWQKLRIHNENGTTTVYAYWLDLLKVDGTWDSGSDYKQQKADQCHPQVVRRIIFEK